MSAGGLDSVKKDCTEKDFCLKGLPIDFRESKIGLGGIRFAFILSAMLIFLYSLAYFSHKHQYTDISQYRCIEVILVPNRVIQI